MGPMNKRIILLFFAIVFFMGAVTFYINHVTIPKDLKKIILIESSQFLGRSLRLKDISFNPFTGFTLEGITILEEDSPDIFATIDRVRVHLLYWPLLRQQKVIISSLELKGVSLNIIHYAAGEWNFSDILQRRSQRTQQPRKVYLSLITIDDGYVRLTNLQDGSQFSEVFSPVDATLAFSVTKGITFETSLHYADQQRFLEIRGNAHPLKEQLRAKVQTNGLALKHYLDLISPELPFTLETIAVKDLDVELSLRRHFLDMAGNMTLEAVALSTPESTLQIRSLALQTFNFAFHDGEYRLNGQLTAQAPQAVFKEHVYAADVLAAQITDSTMRGGALNVLGQLNAAKAAVSSGDQWDFMGDVQLSSIDFSRGAKAMTATVAADIKNVALSVGKNIRMKGDFLSPSLTYISTSGTTTVKGDLYANDLVYAWPPGKELQGMAALTNIQILGNARSQWTAKSQISGQGLGLKLPGGNNLTSGLAGQWTLEYDGKEKEFKVTSAFELSGAAFAMTNGLRLTGSPSGSVVVTSRKDPSAPVPYNGTLEFKDGALSGVPFGPVDSVKGTVAFENNRAKTSGLNAHALGMPVLLTGTIDDFSSPVLDITVHIQNFDLAKTQNIIPKIITDNALTLTGTAPWLTIGYHGSASSTEEADISFEAQVKEATLASAKINKSASAINGAVRFQEKKLLWEDLSAVYNGKSYQLTGSMAPSGQPTIETEIESEKFKLKTRFQYAQDKTIFHQLIGHYKNAVFNLEGSTQAISGGGTMLDVAGEVDLDLNDLPVLFPQLPDGIKNCKLAGMTHIKGSFRGDLSHWQDWQFDLTGASAEFSIWDMKIRNMKFNAVQKNNLLKPFHIWGEFYKGDLNVVASLDTAKNELPFEFVARILDSDLNELRKDTALKKQSLSGTLSSTAILSGNLTDLKSMDGKGGVEVKDGMLWELDLLKGLGGFLLIPEYKDIIFTQAGMNFTLTDAVMSTENIQLLGPSLNLFGKGTLDFNQDQLLDLLLSPDFNTSVVVGSSSLKKGTTAIITGTEKFMSVEVTGTLKEPKYKVNNAPVKILQKTGGVILENVSQFFQNIF